MFSSLTNLVFCIAKKDKALKKKFLETVKLFCLFLLFKYLFVIILIEHGSPEFEEFLNCMGERVSLKGWTQFSGGLNVDGMKILYIYFVY